MCQNCKHENKITSIEAKVSDLEKVQLATDYRIEGLAEKLKGLTSALWALVFTLIPCVLSALGWLIVQVFKH